METSDEVLGGLPQCAEVTGVRFGLMTTETIMRLSVLKSVPHDARPNNLIGAHLGLPSADGACATCEAQTINDCQGHFGHINLPIPIFHPNHVEAVVRVLREVCLNCGQLRKRKKVSLKDSSVSADSESKKRKRLSKSGAELNHEESAYENNGKVPSQLDLAAEEWPDFLCDGGNEPKQDVIVLSSEESDGDGGFRDEPQSTGKNAKVAGPSKLEGKSKGVRKRKFSDDLDGMVNSKSSSKFPRSIGFVDDIAQESNGKSTKSKGKFLQEAKTSGAKSKTASSRRLGYPQPEIHLEVFAKGTTTATGLNPVNVIKMTVNRADVQNLAFDYWDFVEGSSSNREVKRSRYLLPSEALKILRKVPFSSIRQLGMEAWLAHPTALILECIPIPPNCTRVHEEAISNVGGFKLGADRATQAFVKLLRKIYAIKTSRFGKPVFKAALTECSTLQALFQDYLREKGAPKAAPGKENKKLIRLEGYKKAACRWSSEWLKKNVVGKRSAFSARNVVTGDPYLSVGEIGIPSDVAKHVTFSERVTDINRESLQKYVELGQSLGDLTTACVAVRIVSRGERREVTRRTTIELEIGDVVHRNLKNGDLVFINRPPSLHKHSLLALRARIHTEATWTINPALCAPLHADFDGDCLHVFVPQSEDSRAELYELMTLPAQILPSPSEATTLGISQDYILAAYLATSPGFVTKEEIQQLGLWIEKPIPYPTIVKCPSGGPLWTGKQVIDLTIPDEFSFQSGNKSAVVQGGELLTSGEEANWIASTKGLVHSIACKSPELAVKHIDCSQSVLREWLMGHGFSVSIGDFYAAADKNERRKMKLGIQERLEYAKHIAARKQLIVDSNLKNEDHRESGCTGSSLNLAADLSDDLCDVAITSMRESQSTIGDAVVDSIDVNNQLLAMVRSGSKGSCSKVMQQIGSLGLQYVRGDKLLTTSKSMKLMTLAIALGYPSDNNLRGVWEVCGLVRNSLLDGLEPLEFFTHAISTRDGLFRQSQEISGPGELFKKLMLFLRDVHIAYDGTVRNRSGQEIIGFQYEEANSLDNLQCTNSGEESTMGPGEPVGILAATAISQPAYQVLLEANTGLGTRKIRPLDLLQESLYSRRKMKLKAADRRSILRLKRCDCADVYCGEKRILALQAELLPVTLKMVATEVAIEYAGESSERWQNFDFNVRDFAQGQLLPWIGHIQLDEKCMNEKRISQAIILERLEMNIKAVKNVLRKCRLGGVMFCFRDVGECEIEHTERSKRARETGPRRACLHFSFLRLIRKKDRKVKNSKVGEAEEMLEVIQGLIIPMLLDTIVKGIEKIESACVLWEDDGWFPAHVTSIGEKSSSDPSGELVLEVTVKEVYCSRRGKPWQLVQESCLDVMDYVDWSRSSPYTVQEIYTSFGVDAARNVLIQRFLLAVGKYVGEKHLKLVASLMTHSGEIQGLSSFGYKDWMNSLRLPTPFTSGVFRAPMKHFMEAGRKGSGESFKGVLAASVFGKKVPVGTGADFIVNINTVPVTPEFPYSGPSLDILQHLSDLNAKITSAYPSVVSQGKEGPVEELEVTDVGLADWGPNAGTGGQSFETRPCDGEGEHSSWANSDFANLQPANAWDTNTATGQDVAGGWESNSAPTSDARPANAWDTNTATGQDVAGGWESNSAPTSNARPVANVQSANAWETNTSTGQDPSGGWETMTSDNPVAETAIDPWESNAGLSEDSSAWGGGEWS